MSVDSQEQKETHTAASNFNRKASLRIVGDKATRLKKLIGDLKTNYVERRFDEIMAAELEELDMQLVGMPVVPKSSANKKLTPKITPEKLKQAVITTVKTLTESLSRVAIYLDEAVKSESAEPGHSFVDNYQKIQNHHHHGLYYIMCELHKIISAESGESELNKSLNEIKNIEPHNFVSRPIRHLRDYIVLRDMDKFLDHLKKEVESLVRAHRSHHLR